LELVETVIAFPASASDQCEWENFSPVCRAGPESDSCLASAGHRLGGNKQVWPLSLWRI